MNANAMELNLDELEMVAGGDWWNRAKGALVGAAAGAISGAAGAIVGGMAGYEEMVVRTAALID